MSRESELLRAAGITGGGASVEKIGEGFNADGYQIVNAGGKKSFARVLKPGCLGNNTPLERALSASEGTIPLPHTLHAIPIGLTPEGVIDLRSITDIVTVGEFLPPGSINFLDLLRQEETTALAQEVTPLALQMAEAMADIHDWDGIPMNADRKVLYDRANRRIIHDNELTAGVADLIDFSISTWISPYEVDVVLQGLMNQARRTMGSHPERLTPIHGDFWAANIFFHPEKGVITNDTRIGWGEPATDAGWMIGEFLMQDLIRFGEFGHDFTNVVIASLQRYQELRHDPDLLRYIGLGYGFQAFAEAVFTPNLSDTQRRTLFATGIGALANQIEGNELDIANMNKYTLQGLQILERP
jgi:hypothetical protein